ncbi:hypothetical protein [Nesterenkonia ebinurensis]|nr:hypothetical protein [Nesterenkonia ebinurensis]
MGPVPAGISTVKISLGAKKGRIAIDFAGVEDPEGIADTLELHIQR